MLAYILRRLLQTVFVLFGVSTLLFVLLRTSGDPVTLFISDVPDAQTLDKLRESLGFNEPLLIQYGRFIWDVLHGDFGTSFLNRSSAMEVALSRLPATLELTFASLIIGSLVAIPAGIYAAVRRGTWTDVLITGILSVGQAVPIFVVGMLLILLVAVPLDSIPTSGRSGIASLILPSVTIGVFFAARIARITRTSVIEFLGQDFANTARAKGASESRVVIIHVLRNAATTIVTVVGYLFATVMSGAIVTEAVFSWPGLGNLMIQAVRERDYPVVQASVFVVAIFVVTVNMVADLTIAALDPRIRLN